ncbi:MAG: DUF1016 N-terminal domain-containing protein [Bacteroidales bacterium]|nr:DUF1016 N-terminal domain-containing protein [Bacteroidales bacterium]MCF6341357.1 DUF1016 N-terminal domain-containing protein [Bacteroidales bacterium]
MRDFKSLIHNISVVHQQLQQYAANAVNQALTIRNWLIGYYIVEYEQNGSDRAEYGKKLIPNIAKELKNIKGIDIRSLHNFKLLYASYPQVKDFLLVNLKMGSLTTQLGSTNMGLLTTQLMKDQKWGSLTAKSQKLENRVTGEIIITKLSYTHLEQLIRIDDDLKRTFYEIECMKGTWSVRELKRQISSLYYERSELKNLR